MDSPNYNRNASQWSVKVALRVIAAVDALALIAVVMPGSWMAVGHELCGLGTLPDAPIVGYLARSASGLYALHGLLVLYLSFNVERYAELIRWMAKVALGYGIVVIGIDFSEGMPIWWALVEGPWISLSGVAVLWCGKSPARLQTQPTRVLGKWRGNPA